MSRVMTERKNNSEHRRSLPSLHNPARKRHGKHTHHLNNEENVLLTEKNLLAPTAAFREDHGRIQRQKKTMGTFLDMAGPEATSS